MTDRCSSECAPGWMRLGIGSYTYGWAVGTAGSRPPGAMDAEALLRRAAQLRVRVVQLCDNLPPETFAPEVVDRLRDRARALGLAVEVGITGCEPARLRRFAAVAGRLGSRTLRVVLDAPDDRPSLELARRRVREALPELCRHGVRLAIENHDRFTCAKMADLVRAVHSPEVGVCLDTANSFGALEGPAVVVETLGPLAVCLHLKDFAVTRLPHTQGFLVEGRPLGEGGLDLRGLLERMRAFGFEGDAIVEQWVPPEASQAETLRKESEWAERSVRAARKWIDS